VVLVEIEVGAFGLVLHLDVVMVDVGPTDHGAPSRASW
jgi:hypothetical protein